MPEKAAVPYLVAKRLPWWFSWILVSAFACAQPGLDPDKALTQYILEVWTSRDGLPGDEIEAIAQTPDGLLWLGTNRGLVRFDGYRFRPPESHFYPKLASERIKALCHHSETGLWVATVTALYRYHRGKWEIMDGPAGIDDIYDMVVDDQDRVWFATRGEGVIRYENGQFTPLRGESGLTSAMTNKLDFSAETGLLAGTNGGLHQFRDGSFTLIRQRPVYALATARDGSIWCGDFLAGLVHRRPDESETIYASEVGIQAATLNAVMEDRRGNIWASCDNAGLFRFTKGRWSRMGQTDGLPDDRLLCLFEDRAGALWIGTQSGLARLRDGFGLNYGRKEGLPATQHYTVAQDPNGTIWTGSSAGIGRIEPDGEVERITHYLGQQIGIVLGIGISPEGNPWFATLGQGLLFYKDGELGHFEGDLNNPFIHGFNWRRDGSLWVGTDSGGLFEFEPGGTSVRHSQESGWSGVFPRFIHEDRFGELWLSTGDGLFRQEGEVFHKYGKADGLFADDVRSIYEDEAGNLWLSSFGRLCVYDRERFRQIQLPEFSKNGVITMVEDGLGYLWVGTQNGLFRIPKEDLLTRADDPGASMDLRQFHKADGLKGVQFAVGQVAAIRATDGRLWFATDRGILVVDPSQIDAPPNLPTPMLDQLIIDDQTEDTDEAITLPPGRHRVTASFTAVRFEAPESLEFRFRLDPYDDEWQRADQARQATYTNLPPGRYELHYAVRDAANDWVTSPMPFPMQIEPFFYQTAWFVPSLILVAILLTAGLGYWRMQALRHRNIVLGEQVAARTKSLREEKERTQTLYAQLRDTHQQKLDELEEARALQMAMLPEKAPEVSGWEIATMLRTASEVGGDYFDFELSESGELTVAVGDATGHGMKAGLFVAATKSHFLAFANLESPVAILQNISRNLKALKLRHMFMALTLAKINHNQVQLATAGMPPTFLFRHATGEVKELLQKALPLGGFPKFPYKAQVLTMEPGDLLVILTDGLPERFNPEDRMLTEARIGEVLREVGGQSPQVVLDRLFRTGEDWGGDREQDDDIAMVALRYHGHNPS